MMDKHEPQLPPGMTFEEFETAFQNFLEERKKKQEEYRTKKLDCILIDSDTHTGPLLQFLSPDILNYIDHLEIVHAHGEALRRGFSWVGGYLIVNLDALKEEYVTRFRGGVTMQEFHKMEYDCLKEPYAQNYADYLQELERQESFMDAALEEELGGYE